MTDEPLDQDPSSGPMPPPPGPQAPAFRQLVRYPYSRLGGVATGIAYYFGLDPTLVRIAFVLLGLGTGFGVLAYILAWIIMPRASHWPPYGQVNQLANPFANRADGPLSNRDIALGVLGLAFVVVLANGIGGQVFVPLALIGGGIWLLLQPQRDPASTVAAVATVPPRGSAEPDLLSEAERLGAGPWVQPPAPTAYVASTQPTRPERKRRHRGLLGLLAVLGVVLIGLPLLLIGGLFALIGNSDVSIGDVPHRVEVVDSVDDLPLTVSDDGVDLRIDLTGLSAAGIDELGDLDDPAGIRVRADYGRVEVIVPEDLEVSVRTDVAVGRIDLFGEVESGFGSDLDLEVDDAVIDLQLDVNFGEVVLTRK